jgi:hypothetical protein
MLRPAVRARLEKSLRYHEAMSQYHNDSDKKENKQSKAPPSEEQTPPAEQYAEGDQEPGEEVAGEPVDTSQPGAETSTEDESTKAVQPEMQEGSKEQAAKLPRHQKLAKMHAGVAQQLRDLLEGDESRFTVAQARDQQPVRRDPAMAASARRSAIAQQMRRPGRPGGTRGLSTGAIGHG